MKSFCKRSKVQIISPETFKNNTLLEKLNLGLNLFTGIGTDDVEEVNEKYNFSNVIPGDAFEKLENLKLLNFGFSKITFVGSNAFRGLKNLDRLNIEFNQLTDLTGHTFEHLTSVKVINLHGNHLESIGSDVFEGNSLLEKIDFAKNKLKWLPSGLFKNCKHLTELNFERNQIDKIANLHINHLSNLHILDLTFNRIGNILNLGLNCRLIGFSVSISMADFGTHLSKLQMLKLSKNEITTVVDEAFSKLTRLSQLDLSYNRLRVSSKISLVLIIEATKRNSTDTC